MSDDEHRPTSSPPAAKVVAARAAGITAAIGALTDWLAIAAVSYLAAHDKIGGYEAVGVIAFLATGTLYGKAKGRLGGSTMAGLLAAASKAGIAGMIKKTLFMVAFVGLLTGCGTLSDRAVDALPKVLEAAAPHLVRLAQERGVDIDESGAVCIEMPVDAAEDVLPEDWSIPVVAIMCVAPELD